MSNTTEKILALVEDGFSVTFSKDPDMPCGDRFMVIDIVSRRLEDGEVLRGKYHVSIESLRLAVDSTPLDMMLEMVSRSVTVAAKQFYGMPE